MNSAQTSSKKLSDYKVEDLKDLFSDLLKKISSKILLIEISNDHINLASAKAQNNKLFIKKIYRQDLPSEAIDKSIPNDPIAFSTLIIAILKELNINVQRVAIALQSDACYTRLIEIPEIIDEKDSRSFIEDPNSGVQIPISINNSDFDIHLTELPNKIVNKNSFNRYFLTSIPKKSTNIILETIKNARLELCSIQMSHMCIGNILKSEINKLDSKNLIISVDLLDEFSQFIIFDKTGPILIKRLGSIRKYPSISDMKEINKVDLKSEKDAKDKKNSINYHPLSKYDLKILIREIKNSFTDFLNENKLDKKGKIFLSGRNSQHENLVEIIGENLSMEVALISPANHNMIKEFSYNPDQINQFSLSRIVGLGLSLFENNKSDDQDISSKSNFLIKKYMVQETKAKEKENSKPPLNKEKPIKEKKETKAKEKNISDLPPLPDLGLKGKGKELTQPIKDKKIKSDISNLKKDQKSFKMDTSFLEDD